MAHTGQLLHSDGTSTGSVSGLSVELYENDERQFVVEVAGTPIVAYENKTEAAGVFYLLSLLSAEVLAAMIANACTCDVFPVQS